MITWGQIPAGVGGAEAGGEEGGAEVGAEEEGAGEAGEEEEGGVEDVLNRYFLHKFGAETLPFYMNS